MGYFISWKFSFASCFSLINKSYIFLKKPDAVSYTKELNATSRKILLVGEDGTQLMQGLLMKALAKHFGAKLLTISDSLVEVQDDPIDLDAEFVLLCPYFSLS